MMTFRHPLLSALGCLLASAASFAQTQTDHPPASPVQTIKGIVRDIATQRPLVGATVIVLGTRLGARTGSDGSFRIANVPVGRQTVQARMIGYEPITIPVLLTSGRETVLEIELRESVIRSEEIVVEDDPFKPINETALVSAQSFSVEETQRYAGGFGDPGRIAQNFAGVVGGGNDQRNDMVVRGGSPTELLWRLDGIDIPNPNHFATQGASGGPINAINSNLLANSDFLTGAFPAEYGGRLSGVFDLRTRKGNRDRYEFVAQMGFNGFEGMAEGPVPGIDGGSFIISYRKSTLEVFDKINVDLGTGDFVPKYDDATLKVDLPIDATNSLSLTALGGISNAVQKDPKFAVTGQELDLDGSDIGAAGITWTNLLSETMVGQLTLSAQYNQYRRREDSLTAGSGGEIVARTTTWERTSGEGNYGARYRLSYAPMAAHRLTVGIEGRSLFYDLYVAYPLRSVEYDPARRDTSGSTTQGSAYVSWSWRPDETVTVTSGLYGQYLGINGRISIEPRLGASWEFAPMQSLNAGIGVHRQMQPLIVYMNNGANRDLDFTQSIHYIIGYSNQLASDLMVKTEAYYKELANAPVTRDAADDFSMLNVGPDLIPADVRWPLKNEGRGRAYGLEASLVKHFTDGYYATMTGSLFRQEYKGSDGAWRYGIFDNRYVMNILGGYEWKATPRFTVEFSARFSLAGGRRYTPIDIDSSRYYGRTWYDQAQPYAAVLPSYMRLDTRIDFRHNFEGWSLIYYVSALNTLSRQNVMRYWYDAGRDAIESETQLGLIPVGGIRLEF